MILQLGKYFFFKSHGGLLVMFLQKVFKLITKTSLPVFAFLITFNACFSFAGRIFVDSALNQDCISSNYSITNRNCSGIDGNAYRTIQTAIDKMKPGDTILIRGGTYYEMNIYIGNLRNGSKNAWYTISSYPNEWAIVDGRHDLSKAHSQTYNGSIFRGTTQNGVQGYIRFERLEITGGGLDTNSTGYPSDGGGITMRGGPFEFRHLYIHNNYGNVSNNNAGLVLANGTGGTTIEYCFFSANGDVKKDKSTSSANVIIFSNYKYENEMTSLTSENGYYIAMCKNIIRYNLFNGNAGNGYYTVTGFKHKGMQRLTGYQYVDTKNSLDNIPNDNQYESYGDQIYNNIFIGHEVGIEADQDYVQIHNNIIARTNYNRPFSSAVGIQLRDWNTSRRGPHKPCIYNNTLICKGMMGIVHHPVPQNWKGTTPYAKCWIINNIIDGAKSGWHSGPLTVSSDNVTSTGYPLQDINIEKNYFYNSSSDSLAFIHYTYYSKNMVLTHFQDTVFSSLKINTNPLYSSNYITIGTHKLDNDHSIQTAGVNKKHPYLLDSLGKTIFFPAYIGATDPLNCKWVDNVINLSNILQKSSDVKLPSKKLNLSALSIDKNSIVLNWDIVTADTLIFDEVAICYRRDRFAASPTDAETTFYASAKHPGEHTFDDIYSNTNYFFSLFTRNKFNVWNLSDTLTVKSNSEDQTIIQTSLKNTILSDNFRFKRTADHFEIHLSAKTDQKMNISIVNLMGKTVFKKSAIINANTNIFKLPISHLKNGGYILNADLIDKKQNKVNLKKPFIIY